MNLQAKKWAIPGLVVVILLAIGVFVKIAYDANVFGSDFRAIVLGTFQKNPFKKQSQVHVSLVDSKLNLNFDLIEEDRPAFRGFVKNWFDIEEEVKSISFGIDENAKNILSQNLPVDLKIEVSDKSLSFSSKLISGLKNPLGKSDFEFATGSSKLNAQYSDSSKYQFKLEDPYDLVNYATSSGKLTASSKLEGLFKSLPKVATIELNVNGKSISGQIILK